MARKLLWFRLETATMILGWLGTVGSLIAIALFALSIGYADNIAKWIIKLAPEGDTTSDLAEIRTHVVIASVIYIVLCAVNLIASICLILGALKERHLLLLPWLVNSAISIIFSFIYYVFMIIRVAQIELSSGFLLMLVASLGLVFDVYIWLAIYSYFKTLQTNTLQQRQRLLPAAGSTYPSYTKI